MYWLHILLLIVFFGVACALWSILPRWQLNKFYSDITCPRDKAVVEDSFRKTIAQFFAGLMLIFGFFLTVQELLDVRRATSAQLLEVQKQRIANQFSRALGHVADESLHTRIGGIYTLEQVAQAELVYRNPVMNLLSTYVATNECLNQLNSDIRAAVIVLGRRTNKEVESHIPDLRHSCLKRVNLAGVDLSDLIFSGADFNQANLRDAHLDRSQFIDAQFKGADLRSVSAIDAKFTRADFRSISDRVANLGGADLSGAKLTGAKLQGANMRGTKLVNAVLAYANVSDADLSNADLSGANLHNIYGLSDKQISSMKCDKLTKLPHGHSPTKCR